MDITRIVSGFRLDCKTLEEEKKSILEQWKNEVFTEEEFQLILKMCSVIKYYSEKETALSFTKLMGPYIETDFIKNKTVFMPYKNTDERTETSVGIFIQFMYGLDIDSNDTYQGVSQKKIKTLYNSYQEHVSKLQEKDNILRQIEKIKERKRDPINDHVDLAKTLRKKETELIKIQKFIDKDFKSKEAEVFYIKNMIFVDDFIGSGSSIIKLLKKTFNELLFLQDHINFFVLCLEASAEGLKNIDLKKKELGIYNFHVCNLNVAKDILNDETIFNQEEQKKFTDILKKVEKKYKLSYSEKYTTNTAVASFMNAPNNNVSIISVKNDYWLPIFERKKRNINKIKNFRQGDQKALNDKLRMNKKRGRK